MVVSVQVTVVSLTGAAGAHAAFACPVKAALVTGKATVASIQANLFRLERLIAYPPLSRVRQVECLGAVIRKSLVAYDEQLGKNEKIRFCRRAVQKGDNVCVVP